MEKLFLSICLIILGLANVSSQGNCINVAPIGCRFSCVPVMYTGSAPDTATYFWSSTCGTYTHPNQQDPGDLCLLFPGTCTLQVIVLQVGLEPDTCTAEIIVFDNPDGLMEGDTTICSGDCTPITVLFTSGTAPFTYQVDDGQFTNIYSSSTNFDTFLVCPLFSTTYTLLTITDAFGCTVSGQFNEVNIDVVPGVSASISQTGNQLCANPPNANYQWWNCDYSQLQSISQCLTLTQDHCYCLIVADANTSCVDTVCGDFVLPCPLSCGISSPDSVCFGDTIQFTYSGNASDTATFEWLIVVGLDSSTFTGDTVTFFVNDLNCITAELTVTDTSCQISCSKQVCLYSHQFFATLYSAIVTCDSCITIPIGLSGTAPYAVYVSDGIIVDTITGILDDLYNYTYCSLLDSTITFVLLNATDSLSSCPVILGEDSIAVTRYSTPIANITQMNNVLCADTVIGQYAWYDCGYTQLLSDSICYALSDTGCYCLVVTNGTCSDTICGDYIYNPCDLSCNIELIPNACIGDSIVFAYTGNATSGAIFNWLIDLPGFPASPFTGNDTVILNYSQAGCFQVTLTVIDQGCISMCGDSICIDEPHSDASICCDQVRCDTCTDLMVTLNGTPPWTIFIGEGTKVDTISGITSSPYVYHVCPPRDSTFTYTLLGVQDTINTCPGYVVGTNTASVTLHPLPTASITQIVDLLCANPAGMAGYGWYTCPSGGYLDTSRCFLPSVSGCYCVDVSDQYDCVDTACINIILSGIEEVEKNFFSLYPNPFQDKLYLQIDDAVTSPVEWIMMDIFGKIIEKGRVEERQHTLNIKHNLPAGIYLFQLNSADGKMSGTRRIHN